MYNFDEANYDYEGDYRDDENLEDMRPDSWTFPEYQVTGDAT